MIRTECCCDHTDAYAAAFVDADAVVAAADPATPAASAAVAAADPDNAADLDAAPVAVATPAVDDTPLLL